MPVLRLVFALNVFLLPESLLAKDALYLPAIEAPLAIHSLLLDITQTETRMFAVGERAHILIAETDSKEWRQVSSLTQATLTSVFFINDTIGWITGHDAVILKITDGGEHWTAHILPTESMLTDMLLTPENNLMLSGLDGTVLLKTASTVLRYASPNRDDFLSLTQISNSEFVLVGSQGLHYVNIQDFQ